MEGSGRKKSKFFIFVYKCILYQIAVSHQSLKRKGFFTSGKKKIYKEAVLFQTKNHKKL